MPVNKGDKVKVEYTGTLDDGTIFDSSQKQGQPLEFVAGGGQVIKGFDNAIIGMDINQEKNIKLTPDEAYGQPNPQMIQKVPKAQFPQNQDIKTGMTFGVTLPNGQQLPAKVVNADDKDITLDLNHPLAGKNLNFKLKVVEVVGGETPVTAEKPQETTTPVEQPVSTPITEEKKGDVSSAPKVDNEPTNM